VDRVQIGAVALAVVAFGLYFATLPPSRSERQPGGSSSPPERVLDAAQEPDRNVAPPESEPLAQAERTWLENDAVRIWVSAVGRLESIELPAFPDRKGSDARPVQLVSDASRGVLRLSFGDAALAAFEHDAWEVLPRGNRAVDLRMEKDGVEIIRSFDLDAQGYGAKTRVAIRNRSAKAVRPRLQLSVAGRDEDTDSPNRLAHYSLFWEQEGGVERRPLAGIGTPGFWGRLFGSSPPGEQLIRPPVDAVGADSQYFLLAVMADNPRESQAVVVPAGASAGQVVLQYGETDLPPGTSVERSWRLYVGPKVPQIVRAVDPRFESTINVGWSWVRPLVNLFSSALKWLHDRAVGNYGIAIIILTVLLRLLTYPLTQRSMQSMKKFSAIAPQMKELQEKYGGDRAKLQEEMMKLYRERGINPLTSLGGGCIPMLIQMPFMVALYFALQSSIELRHAPFFGWIDDLSAPEQLFGMPIRLLPLAMGVSMLLQQRLTPSPTADPQQRQMMSMMSVMFVVLFYGFPSGLVLYWFVSNLLGIAQQLWVNRAPSPAS